MKQPYSTLKVILFGFIACFASCSDNVSEDSYYTFTDETVASY